MTRRKKKARRKPKSEERAIARARNAKPKPPGHARAAMDAVLKRVSYAERIVGRFLLGDIDDGFTQRTIHQRRFAGLTSVEGIDWGLRYLVESGRLRSIRVDTGGRPRDDLLF